MARKIRFPLIMKDGAEVRTLDELRENFDLEAVLGYFADGKLLTWLQNRYYDVESEKISALNPENSSFEAQLCEALGVTFSKNNIEEFDLDYINRRNEKKEILSQLTTDEKLLQNIDYVALNQEDLIDCFDIGAKTIYLVGKTVFTIPLSVTGITYIGHSDAKAVIRATDNVNFKEKNITFMDIQFSWDTSVITPNDKVYQAEQMLARGQDSEAISLLEAIAESNHPRALLILGNYYSDNDTEKAQMYYKRAADLGHDEAIIKNNNNSELKAASPKGSISNSSIIFQNKNEGDIVEFGQYNTKPIEWIILKRRQSQVLLLAKENITFMPVLGDYRILGDWGSNFCWHKSYIRKWLNEDFLNCFTANERQLIIENNLSNYEYSKYKISLTQNTSDKFFLLSVEEFMQLNKDEKIMPLFKTDKYWWLRSTSGSLGLSTINYYIDTEGQICGCDCDRYGDKNKLKKYGVRPVVRLTSDSDISINEFKEIIHYSNPNLQCKKIVKKRRR